MTQPSQRSLFVGKPGYSLFPWYNHEHRHSGLGFLTPAVVHFGQAAPVRAHRQQVLAAAYTDRKFKDPWTGRLPTRFVVLTNELPRLTDSSGALASRFVVFVLRNSFYGNENPGLTDELLAEAPAIFNWTLEGLDRLNERGYFVSLTSGREAVQQLEDLSSPVSAFVRDTCVVEGLNRVDVDALWAAWKSWCEEEGRHPGTKTGLGRDLKAAVPTVKRTRPRTEGEERQYVYEGIGLRENSGRSPGPLGPDDVGPSGPRSTPMYSGPEASNDADDYYGA